jgi:transposase InsO family protein
MKRSRFSEDGADQHGDPDVEQGERRRLALHSAGQAATERARGELHQPAQDECLNETLFASLPQVRAVLDAWRADYNGVRSHSALANRTPEEFRTQHIAIAASAASGQNFTRGLYS